MATVQQFNGCLNSNRYYDSTSSSTSSSFSNLSTRVDIVTTSLDELRQSVESIVNKKEEPKIEIIKTPLYDEIIVVSIDTNEFSLEEADNIVRNLQKEFPYNQVIGIPKGVEIKVSSAEVI